MDFQWNIYYIKRNALLFMDLFIDKKYRYNKVIGCASVALDLANRRTDIVLLYTETSYRSREGFDCPKKNPSLPLDVAASP